MKKIFTFLLLGLILPVFGQHGGEYCSHHKSGMHLERSASLSLYDIQQTEEYDVTFYFLDVAINYDAVGVDGRVEVHATSKVPVLDTFLIELHEDLALTDVLLNGVTSVPFVRVGSAIKIPCSFGLGDSFYYEFVYNGIPPASGATPFGGGGMSNDSSPSWGNQVTWTLSEPFSAYEWFVCKQSLKDKADSVYVFVTCDSTAMAGSQGTLTNVVDVAPDQKRYEWKSQYPINYYLISVTVAEYVDYSFFANPTGAPAPILVQNFIYDNPACLSFFMSEIDLTADFIEHFSDIYGLYPFHEEKYGHCMAPFGGGMEHQTMTSQGWFESGLTAHELGHQWFGDNVTCGSWADIWLNEGFASYSEELMMEEFYPGDEVGSMVDRHDNIMSQPGGSVYVDDTLNPGRIFSGRLSYDKGAAIIHTLRFLVNDDDAFFNALQVYQTTFKDTAVLATDFKALIESELGMDFTKYFDEWYYGQGFPTYSLVYNKVGGTAFVEVNQTVSMPGVTPYFTNDLEILVVGTGGYTEVVRLSTIDGISSLHSFSFPEEIASIEIDPNNWIINQDGTITEDMNLVGLEEDIDVAITVYPNPTSGIIQVGSNGNIGYEIYSITGAKVDAGWLIEGNNQIDLTPLKNGVYYLKLNEALHKIVKQ